MQQNINEENNFDKNLKEIREMSLKINEPLEEPSTILYFDHENKKIKYEGGYENGKYEKSSVTGMSNNMGKAFALRYPGYNGAYPESYRGRYAQQMCVNPNTKGYTGRR